MGDTILTNKEMILEGCPTQSPNFQILLCSEISSIFSIIARDNGTEARLGAVSFILHERQGLP